MESQTSVKLLLVERFFTVLAAIACLVISVYFWIVISRQQAMWPLPALYLIEIMGVGIIAGGCAVFDWAFGGIILWIVIGIQTAFVVLAVWSIGLFYVPVVFLLLAAGIVFEMRKRQRVGLHLLLGIAAAATQFGLMLLTIRHLYSSAVYLV
jgi:hypothetical protein